jgi:hypothetical protein
MKPPPCFNMTLYRIHHRIDPLHLSPIRPCAGIKRHEKLWTAVLPALSGHSHVIHTQFFYSLAISISLFSSSSLSSYFRRKNGRCLCTPHGIALCAPFSSPLIAPNPSLATMFLPSVLDAQLSSVQLLQFWFCATVPLKSSYMCVVQQDRAGLAGHAIVIHMCSQAGADAPLEYCCAAGCS